MSACKIRKIEQGSIIKSQPIYSIDHSKLIIRSAIELHHGLAESEIETTNMDSESQLVDWEFVMWYAGRLDYDPKPIFSDKSEILWESLDDMEIASLLVRSDANLNVKKPGDESKSTFLHVLSASDDPEKHELAVLMIEYGANVNIYDAEGNMPLHLAVKSDAFRVIVAILKAHQEEVLEYDSYHFPPKGYGKFIELALRSPNVIALLNLFSQYSNLDIYQCCKSLPCNMPNDQLSAVVHKLTHIANQTSASDVQYIWRYVMSKNFEIAKLMFGIKKDGTKLFNIQNLLSNEFIIDNPAIIVFLLREGANINDCVDDSKQYPLHKACARYKQDIVKLLLRLGADVNVTDSLGKTPFSMYFIKDVSMISLRQFSEVMIKHFACLTSLGIRVNESDLSLIRERPDLQKFYTSCIEELGRMTGDGYGFLYDSLFRQTSYELSLGMRNNEFFRKLRKILLNLLPNTFPIFVDDMMKKFQLARDMRNIEVDKEREVHNMFNGILPYVASSEIARYTIDHIEIEFIMCCTLDRHIN